MVKLDTDHLMQCVKTLEYSIECLKSSKSDSIDYEVFRNAIIYVVQCREILLFVISYLTCVINYVTHLSLEELGHDYVEIFSLFVIPHLTCVIN